MTLIYSYTKEDAIADGSQICISEHCGIAREVGFTCPVYFTDTVVNTIQPDHMITGLDLEEQSQTNGRVYDVLYMAMLEAKKKIARNEEGASPYKVIIGRETHTFYIAFHPAEGFTIMSRGEL